jgi:hypothetical protein
LVSLCSYIRELLKADKSALSSSGAVDSFQLFQVLAVDFRIRTKEVEVRAQRLPLALLLHLLFSELVAFAFVNVKDFDLHVLAPARQIRENGSPLAEVADHVAADVAAEHGAGQRILEEDLYHLFYS